MTSARALAVVFVTALATRLAAVWGLHELPLTRAPQLDSLEYLVWATRLAADASYWPAYPEHGPGYPMFLALLLRLFDGSLTAVRVVQAVLGAMTCVLTARIASRVWSPRAALPAGLLVALYAPLIYLDIAILSEPLAMFLLTLALDLATRAGARPSRWLWCGVALGAAASVRPTGVAVAAVFALLLLWEWRRGRVRPGVLAALAAGVLIVTGPVVLQNWRVTGIPLLQAYGGMNFYMGNAPSGDGAARARTGGQWDQLEGEASLIGADRNAQDAYFVRKTVAEIAADPLAYVRLLGGKAVWITQAQEVRDTHSYYFFRDAFPLLRWLPGFGILAALAALAILTWRRATNLRWVIAYIAALALTLLFLLIGLRYRAPLVPALCVLAGGSIAVLIEWVRARAWRQVAAAAAVFAAVFLAAHLRSDPTAYNFAEEWSFTGLSLLNERNVADAEAAFRRAIELDPRSSFAWDGLGLTLQRKGQVTAAHAAFQRATEVNPSNALAWYHVGLSFDQQRDRAHAIEAYRRSLAIAPERSDVLYSLGSALLVEGAVGPAETLFRKVGPRGDPRAYLGLAVIALQRRDVAAAEEALANAQRLGADPARLQPLHAAVTQLRLGRP
jgi:tetratricopeptide (TPR) repeat protein